MITNNGDPVARICIGTGGLEENYNDDDNSIVYKYKEFLDLGFNFFDSGSVYDNLRSIRIIGELYKTNKNKIFLNNKFHPRCSNEKDIIDDTEKILQTLKIDCLDMLQSHWPNIKLPNEEIFSAFSKLKKQGKIKYFGLSNPFLNILLDKKILSQIDSLQIETNTYQNNLDLNFNKLILGYSVFKYLKSDQNIKNNINYSDHLCFLLKKGITPIIRTLDINKIKSLINIEKQEINELKIKKLDNLYEKKIISLNLNQINFPENLKTFKNINEAILNAIKLNPSPIEISEEIKGGNIIKPLKVFKERSEYFILDGINRLWAYKILNISNVECVIIDV